jgi:hypothetical protein
MKFIKPWPKDATEVSEKITWAFFYVMVFGGYLFMQLIALGFLVQSGSYAGLVHSTKPASHVFGFALTTFAVAYAVADLKDNPNVFFKDDAGNKIFTLALMALSLWAYTGFQS